MIVFSDVSFSVGTTGSCVIEDLLAGAGANGLTRVKKNNDHCFSPYPRKGNAANLIFEFLSSTNPLWQVAIDIEISRGLFQKQIRIRRFESRTLFCIREKALIERKCGSF